MIHVTIMTPEKITLKISKVKNWSIFYHEICFQIAFLRENFQFITVKIRCGPRYRGTENTGGSRESTEQREAAKVFCPKVMSGK